MDNNATITYERDSVIFLPVSNQDSRVVLRCSPRVSRRGGIQSSSIIKPMILWIWLFRLLSGERVRKATPRERQFFSAYFLFIPLWGAFFAWFGINLMKRAGGVSEWFFATVAAVILVFGSFYWGKLVREKITWSLGAIVWAVALFLAVTGRLL